MKVQKIEILSDLSYDLKDIEDYNSDVLVELENSSSKIDKARSVMGFKNSYR